MHRDLSHTLSRRRLLGTTAMGLSGMALSSLMAESRSHFPAKAKRVIWLFMHGGPSHVDLFDPKPELIRHAGKPLPESYGAVETRRKVAQNPLLAPVKPFRKHGQSGIEIQLHGSHLSSDVLGDDCALGRLYVSLFSFSIDNCYPCRNIRGRFIN